MLLLLVLLLCARFTACRAAACCLLQCFNVCLQQHHAVSRTPPQGLSEQN